MRLVPVGGGGGGGGGGSKTSDDEAEEELDIEWVGSKTNDDEAEEELDIEWVELDSEWEEGDGWEQVYDEGLADDYCGEHEHLAKFKKQSDEDGTTLTFYVSTYCGG